MTAFGDNCKPVSSVEFDYPTEEIAADPEDIRRACHSTELALLRLLCSKAEPQQIGTRALLILHLLNKGDLSRKELATRLGVSRQRVHQGLTKIKRDLSVLARVSKHAP